MITGEWKDGEGGGEEIAKTILSKTSKSMKCRFLVDFFSLVVNKKKIGKKYIGDSRERDKKNSFVVRKCLL